LEMPKVTGVTFSWYNWILIGLRNTLTRFSVGQEVSSKLTAVTVL